MACPDHDSKSAIVAVVIFAVTDQHDARPIEPATLKCGTPVFPPVGAAIL
jgi:hypothetical protein